MPQVNAGLWPGILGLYLPGPGLLVLKEVSIRGPRVKCGSSRFVSLMLGL